jgi:hypothetical protein
MSFSFDPKKGLVTVRAELWGSAGSAVLRLALDTGATGTLVNVGLLVAIGYDPALSPNRIQVTTGSGSSLCRASHWRRSGPWGRIASVFQF